MASERKRFFFFFLNATGPKLPSTTFLSFRISEGLFAYFSVIGYDFLSGTSAAPDELVQHL